MGLNSFVASEPRPLPVIVLADTSGSMRGEKIDQLNLALRDMLSTLHDADDIRGKFQVCVIAFGGDVEIVQPLADIDGLKISELKAAGRTPMGQALQLAKEMIEDRNLIPSRAYAPTVVLVSDGIPTDCPESNCESQFYQDWEPLKRLCNDGRSSKCQRLALEIGADADHAMLKAFINNPSIPLMKARDAADIAKFFKWVAMSTVARIKSVTPNDVSVFVPFIDIDDNDEII